MSTFNPDSFLNTVVKEANSTETVLVPATEHSAFIKDVKPRQQGEWAVLDIHWQVIDEEVEKLVGRTPIVKQSIFLDLTDAGSLDFGKGKNVPLGRLREAVGQNQNGKAWSPGQLVGAVAVVKVSHSADKNSVMRANVTAVAKA